MRMSHAMIERCRATVDTPLKKRLRAALLPIIKYQKGIELLGEGFQWGTPFQARGARIGRYSYIGAGGHIDGPIVIGDLVMISTGFRLIGFDHNFDDPTLPTRLNFPTTARPTTIIEADVWVGHGVTMMEGLTIGRGSVIAAGAVVTKSVPPYSVVGGVPARMIRDRFTKEEISQYEQIAYDPSDRLEATP